MMTIPSLVPLLLAWLPAQSPQEPAAPPTTLLRLKSGDIAFGEILGHDPDGITFKLLETGGEVPLSWSVLDPDEAQGMRLRYGYVEAEAEELMVDAERLELANGSELVGRIVNRSDTQLWVKRAEATVPIAKTQVRGTITNVQAPALDIFTKEELFQDKAFELQGRLGATGRAGAQAHDELARFAERLFDFAHALEHYQRAAELDPTYESTRMTTSIARCKEKAALQQQVDQLGEIDLRRAQKRYDKALALLEQFRTLYPKSPLLEDLNKLRDRVAKSQERDLRDAIISRWYFWALRLAHEAGRKTSFEEVQGYLDEKMSEDIVNKVRADVQSISPGIEVDRVRRLWNERKGGDFHQSTYSIGTWLLGESARAELDKPKDKDKDKKEPEKGTQSEMRKRLEERMKRYLDNQKIARQQAQDTDKSDDPQAFWEGWTSAGRAQWVLSYYAEKSGDFRDVTPRFDNCRDCGGTGGKEWVNSGNAGNAQSGGSGQVGGNQANETLIPCPTCHHIGIVRRVRYR